MKIPSYYRTLVVQNSRFKSTIEVFVEVQQQYFWIKYKKEMLIGQSFSDSKDKSARGTSVSRTQPTAPIPQLSPVAFLHGI